MPGLPERVVAKQLYPNEPRGVCPVKPLMLLALVSLVPAAASSADVEPAQPDRPGHRQQRHPSGPLRNPANDAALMKETLKKVGFDVIAKYDADQVTMKRAIQDFGARLDTAGSKAVGLFYYAGHGVQLGGRQ